MLSSKLYSSIARTGVRYSHHAATAKSVPSPRGNWKIKEGKKKTTVLMDI